MGDIENTKRNFEVENFLSDLERLPDTLGIEKEELGAYYTDKELVNYIINNLEIRTDSYILDPSCGCSCGCGSFIFPLYFRMFWPKGESLKSGITTSIRTPYRLAWHWIRQSSTTWNYLTRI